MAELREAVLQAELAQRRLGETVETLHEAVGDWPQRRALVDVIPCARLIPRGEITRFETFLSQREIRKADILLSKIEREIASLERDTTAIAKTLETEINALRELLIRRAEAEQSDARARLDQLSSEYASIEKQIATLTQEFSEASKIVDQHDKQISLILSVPDVYPEDEVVGDLSPDAKKCTGTSSAEEQSRVVTLTEDLLRTRLARNAELKEYIETLEAELETVRERHDGAKTLSERARDFKMRLEMRRRQEEERQARRHYIECMERNQKIERLEAQLEKEANELDALEQKQKRRLSTSSAANAAIVAAADAWMRVSPAVSSRSEQRTRRRSRAESFAKDHSKDERDARREVLFQRLQCQLDEYRGLVTGAVTRVQEAERKRSESLLAVTEMLNDVVPRGPATVSVLEKLLKRLFGRVHSATTSSEQLLGGDSAPEITERKCAVASVKSETYSYGKSALSSAQAILERAGVVEVLNDIIFACPVESVQQERTQ